METSLYNGHFREPVTLTPLAERLAVKLSLPETTKTTKVELRILPFMVDNFSVKIFRSSQIFNNQQFVHYSEQMGMIIAIYIYVHASHN